MRPERRAFAGDHRPQRLIDACVHSEVEWAMANGWLLCSFNEMVQGSGRRYAIRKRPSGVGEKGNR